MNPLFSPSSDLPEGDDARIDAEALRQAREARGLSVVEAARLLTLSRAQVEQIEGGGISAFYSPAHKALAVRKYAAGFGLDGDAVLGLVPMAAAAQADAGPPAATSEPMPEPMPEQVPANMPAAPAADSAPAPDAERSASPPMLPTATTLVDVRASVRSLMLGLLLFSAVAIAFAIVRGWVDRFAAAPLALAAEPPAEPAPPNPDAGQSGPAGEPEAAPAVSLSDECAPLALTDSVPQWTPPYVRKPGSRLYIGGPAGSEVCVSDSAGKVSRLVLKEGAMQAVDGRPPYLVQSASLDALQMFLQGLKVKTPTQSGVMRLLPGRGAAVDAQSDATLPAS